MCVNNLSKVALDSAAAGIEPATSTHKSNALTTVPPSHQYIISRQYSKLYSTLVARQWLVWHSGNSIGHKVTLHRAQLVLGSSILRHMAATDSLLNQVELYPDWPLHDDIIHLPLTVTYVSKATLEGSCFSGCIKSMA